MNPLHILSCDPCVGARTGLFCRSLWWGLVCGIILQSIVFWSMSGFLQHNYVYATEVAPRLGTSSLICFAVNSVRVTAQNKQQYNMKQQAF